MSRLYATKTSQPSRCYGERRKISWPLQALHQVSSGQSFKRSNGHRGLIQCGAWALESYSAWLKFGISNGLKKKFKLHTVYGNFMLWFWRLLNLYNLLVRWQSLSLNPSLSPCLSSGNLSKGSSRRKSKAERAKSTTKLFGQLFCSACAGQMGEHKHRVFPSRQQSLLAATGLLAFAILTQFKSQ